MINLKNLCHRIEVSMWHIAIHLMRKSPVARSLVQMVVGSALRIRTHLENAKISATYLGITTGGAVAAYVVGYLLAQ